MLEVYQQVFLSSKGKSDLLEWVSWCSSWNDWSCWINSSIIMSSRDWDCDSGLGLPLTDPRDDEDTLLVMISLGLSLRVHFFVDVACNVDVVSINAFPYWLWGRMPAVASWLETGGGTLSPFAAASLADAQIVVLHSAEWHLCDLQRCESRVAYPTPFDRYGLTATQLELAKSIDDYCVYRGKCCRGFLCKPQALSWSIEKVIYVGGGPRRMKRL